MTATHLKHRPLAEKPLGEGRTGKLPRGCEFLVPVAGLLQEDRAWRSRRT